MKDNGIRKLCKKENIMYQRLFCKITITNEVKVSGLLVINHAQLSLRQTQLERINQRTNISKPAGIQDKIGWKEGGDDAMGWWITNGVFDQGSRCGSRCVSRCGWKVGFHNITLSSVSDGGVKLRNLIHWVTFLMGHTGVSGRSPNDSPGEMLSQRLGRQNSVWADTGQDTKKEDGWKGWLSGLTLVRIRGKKMAEKAGCRGWHWSGYEERRWLKRRVLWADTGKQGLKGNAMRKWAMIRRKGKRIGEDIVRKFWGMEEWK